MAWRGVAWRGVAWRGVAWRGVALRGEACTIQLPCASPPPSCRLIAASAPSSGRKRAASASTPSASKAANVGGLRVVALHKSATPTAGDEDDDQEVEVAPPAKRTLARLASATLKGIMRDYSETTQHKTIEVSCA